MQAFAEPSQADTGAGNQDASGFASTSKEHYDHASAPNASSQPPGNLSSQTAAVPTSTEQGDAKPGEGHQSAASSHGAQGANTVALPSDGHGDFAAEQLQGSSSGAQDGKLMSLLMA